MDGDMYESTFMALEYLYSKVAPGGFVIVDDYGSHEPCRLAVDDFRRDHGIDEPLHATDWSEVRWRKRR
jgi:O-methyltransferase